MTKFGVFTLLLLCTMAITTAQDNGNAGGQAGSVTSDTSADITAPPSSTTAPPMNPPNAMNPVTTGAPAPPAAPMTEAPAPGWAANPVPMTNSGSSSLGSDIKIPVMKKPKRTGDTSRSQSNTPTPIEDSGAFTLISTTGACAIMGLMGLAAVL